MIKLYTAVGIFKLEKSDIRRRYPVVYLGGKECILDIQEMMVWSALNWRILQYDELHTYYKKYKSAPNDTFSLHFDEVMKRLSIRGLIAEGNGETGEEALYRLLSNLTVIPLNDNPAIRLFSTLRLWLVYQIPLSKAKILFRRDRKTKGEKKIMKLAFQWTLSSAEMVKCMEKNRLYFTDEDDLIDFLYKEPEVTRDNIANFVRQLSHCKLVITDIANLYLRKQILFERL